MRKKKEKEKKGEREKEKRLTPPRSYLSSLFIQRNFAGSARFMFPFPGRLFYNVDPCKDPPWRRK